MFSTYKNKKSIILENDTMRAEFIPDPGGKMVSLVGKETGYEYLVQRPNINYLDQPFDGTYVLGECSGYDDMFPTIDLCYYAEDPWKGVKMADHGEVWALPWSLRTTNDAITMKVKGVRFPYELEKQINFVNENTLRFHYTLTNLADSDFEFLWAGHFMINIEEGTQLLLPDDCSEAITVMTNTSRRFGDIQPWPHFINKDGEPYRADICRPPGVTGFEKYYFKNKLKKGWCALQYPGHNKKLEIAFSEATVPYLGILMNENGWDGLYNIFIEPCTICFDKPDLAKEYAGQVSRVNGRGNYKWFIDLTVK